MPSLKKIKNKQGKITGYQVNIRYKGIEKYKTFPVKGNEAKTVQREAYAYGLDIEKQINEGIYRKEEKKHNFTVAQAIDKYIEDTNPNCVTYLNWFKKQIGSLPIRNLQRADIKACRNKLQNKHKIIPIKGQLGKGKETDKLISNSSINRYLAYFSTFLTYCVIEYEILEANPMIGAKLKLKENEPRKRWLKDLKERQTLLHACKQADFELYLVVLFALTTGARKSEIINLTWKNADLENKAIYFLNTKNGDDRTIPIPDILYSELKAFKEKNKIRKLNNDYIFKNQQGKPNEFLIGKLYPKIVNEWEFEDITFHGLRHTYISISSLLGTNQSITKKIVGHKFDSVTGGYTHADCETLRKPMNETANYMLYGTIENINQDNKLITGME